MNKRDYSRTENCTPANITAGYQYTWQGAQRPVPTLHADYRLRRGCCDDAAVAVRVETAPRFLVQPRGSITCSTAGNKTKRFEGSDDNDV